MTNPELVKTHKKRKQQLIEEYKALSDELGMAVDPLAKIQIKRRLDSIEKKIEAIDKKIQETEEKLESIPQVETPPVKKIKTLQQLLKNLILWRHGLVPASLIIFLFISWFLRIELYSRLIAAAPSAVTSPAIIIAGDSDLASQLTSELAIKDNSPPTPLSNPLQITITPAESDNINLVVELPAVSAYELDFWQEVRVFKGVMPFNDAVTFSQAALAYSIGDFQQVIAKLSGRQLPLEAYILRAQAYLFTDDLERSRQDYETALSNIDEVHQDESILKMGLALAYWRPALGITEDINVRQEYCPTALAIYEDLISVQKLKGDVVIVKEIARLYCGPVGPAYFGSLDEIRNKAEELEANQALVNFWEAITLNQFQKDNERVRLLLTQVTEETPTVHLANAMLGFWYARNSNFIGEQCHQSKLYYQRYVDNLYTDIDRSIAQDLLKELYTFSFAELC